MLRCVAWICVIAMSIKLVEWHAMRAANVIVQRNACELMVRIDLEIERDAPIRSGMEDAHPGIGTRLHSRDDLLRFVCPGDDDREGPPVEDVHLACAWLLCLFAFAVVCNLCT